MSAEVLHPRPISAPDSTPFSYRPRPFRPRPPLLGPTISLGGPAPSPCRPSLVCLIPLLVAIALLGAGDNGFCRRYRDDTEQNRRPLKRRTPSKGKLVVTP